MFDLIAGLPLHPLVVHAVVVLLPLAALGTVLIAFAPDWRTKYGHLVVSVAAIATILIPVATESGESLEKHVGDPGKHAELGDQLIWFALPLLVLVIILVLMQRRTPVHRPARDVVAALAVVAALMTGIQVYRVGDSGARAAWADQVTDSARL